VSQTYDEIRRKEELYQLNTYRKLPIAIERGEGCSVYDSEGRRYLDLYGGHAVALTGHCHPDIVAAVQEQVARLVFYSNVVYSSIRAEASEAIISVAPRGMDKVFFCNSGAEANETAMKICRRYTGRGTIIAMEGGFHGRTAGALSATGLGDYRKQFSPLLPDYLFVRFGSIDAVKQAIASAGGEVAGVILEPIQSMAGVEMADEGYYTGLRKLCSDHGIVLIFDEVQTGFGRTGSWFFGDRIGVVPDIITLAKGIGGGIPVGGVVISAHIAKTIGHGEHGSTFGGGPVACAAISANIAVIQREGLVQNALSMGAHLGGELSALPFVKRVKGRGLLLGVEIDRDAAVLRDFLLDRGIITGTSSQKNVLRLLPPLTLRRPDADVFMREMKNFS
jgi:acetylornithine/N-succinyldiaminopimelate aminotransferase